MYAFRNDHLASDNPLLCASLRLTISPILSIPELPIVICAGVFILPWLLLLSSLKFYGKVSDIPERDNLIAICDLLPHKIFCRSSQTFLEPNKFKLFEDGF